jgi:ATP phosphoribosyltransferase
MKIVRLAVPSKGRLSGPVVAILRDAGLMFEQAERALSVQVRNVPMEILFVRTEDIVELVADGVADAGVTGEDLVVESGVDLVTVSKLDIGHCRLVAAVPNTSPIARVADFAGQRIATSHPDTASRFFADRGIAVTTVPLRGAVEVAPKLDVADAIVDLVSSGSTLLVNGLRPIATLLEAQAVLVATPESAGHPEIERLATMVGAVVAGRGKRYLLMNAPADAVPAIERIIPGLEAPSVVPLAHNGMVAVHSTVDADALWHVLPDLRAAGASGILVLPVEQMVS